MASIEELREERIKKLNILKERGVNPYPAHTNRSIFVSDFFEAFSTLEKNQKEEVISGRLMSLRKHGGSVFADIYDGTGKLQLYLKSDEISEDDFTLFDEVVDIGDFVEVSGVAVVTRTGQESLLVKSWRMLSKSLRPLPEKFHGLQDEEERLRKRYLDILFNKEVHDMVEKRAKFWHATRTFLLNEGFLEVDTPVLETTAGGADARPFATHHNALDIDVYLRISAGELWQKKLMVAGFPKVFEIGRIFRNEGMSAEHLQDYTQMEFYWGYADYKMGMDLVKEMYRFIAEETIGTQKFTVGEFEIDLSKEWELYDYTDTIMEKTGIDILKADLKDMEKKLQELKVEYDKEGFNKERATDMLWKYCRKQITGPGFLVGVPKSMTPLAKEDSTRPGYSEQFQPIVAGSEVGRGYSELNDPIDQAERFTKQQAMRDAGDEEAQMYDEDFVEALEYGMPPTCGYGMSERFFSFLMNKPIRETQIFPLMRPK
ncbi:lysine--tRNA ligase [Candidatus Campbellbacteria bacterium CG22_combo_CG10-13_8_21_14_all_36_13]|uniref:Lysine--tRNA ligase n=1 Tax=Candidatus Campbellbacteria bacterium CG22_combo_CG10-13_8_21_14_all_36_13 TaxID=1974529 RepID=A0A2H0DZL0_9BACT|nr:MAG: lysine--tRNA ligase [Candidatus Campbellbacteria bacterium CG22_combo_CG10-13_8_21_14_all_36_13]